MSTRTTLSTRGNSHHFNYLFITNKRSHFKQHAHLKDGKRLRTRWLVSRTENQNVHLAFCRITFVCVRLSTYFVCTTCVYCIGCRVQTCAAAAIVKCVHVAVIVCHRFAHRRTINGEEVWSIGRLRLHVYIQCHISTFIYRRHNIRPKRQNDRKTKCETLEIAS